MLGVKQKTSKQTDKPTVVTEKGPKIQNQYIMWKMYYYSHLVNKALSEQSPEEIDKRIRGHLLSKKQMV